jgi:hypothetical protein
VEVEVEVSAVEVMEELELGLPLCRCC